MKKEGVSKVAQRCGRQRVRMRPWLEDLLDDNSCPGLRWDDPSRRVFRIAWKHASGRTWKAEKDTDIFKRYAIHTGKYKEGSEDADPKKWKANFRCALNSLTDVKELTNRSYKKGERAERVYQFVGDFIKNTKKSKKKNGKKVECISDSEDSTSVSNIPAIEPPPETVVKSEVKEEGDMAEYMETSCSRNPERMVESNPTEEPYETDSPQFSPPGIPILPIFNNADLLSGGSVKVSEQKPFTSHILDIQDIIRGSKSADGDIDSNSTGSGETMTDEEVIDMVDELSRNRCEEGFSETDSSSCGSPPSTIMSGLWNMTLDVGPIPSTAVRVEVPSVVTERMPNASQPWRLTALT